MTRHIMTTSTQHI